MSCRHPLSRVSALRCQSDWSVCQGLSLRLAPRAGQTGFLGQVSMLWGDFFLEYPSVYSTTGIN